MVRNARMAWDDEEGFDLRGQRGRLDELGDPFPDAFPPDLPDPAPVKPASRRRRRKRKKRRHTASPESAQGAAAVAAAGGPSRETVRSSEADQRLPNGTSSGSNHEAPSTARRRDEEA